MHSHSLDRWAHAHDFNTQAGDGERRTRLVVLLTAVMMVVEILAGYMFGSMALLADGWHMATHVAALSITLFTYSYARRHADNPVYSFGTGKVSALGGFASAMTLAVVALLMAIESVERLISPESIRFNEAIMVAVIGLIVNLLSAWLLHDADGHHHHHGYAHGHEHHAGDHNLRAAYLHVLADALTSLLAIFALIAGKFYGLIWMDALMGIVGALVISRWGYGLLRETSRVLLDSVPGEKSLDAIRSAIESDSDNLIADLHVWRLGSQGYGVIISLVSHEPKDPQHYKALLAGIKDLKHVTIEVNGCDGDSCIPIDQFQV